MLQKMLNSVMVCEIQSGWEEVHQANAHIAEVALAQLAGRKQECIVAITTMKNRTAMIFLGKVVGSPEKSFQKVSFKPVCLCTSLVTSCSPALYENRQACLLVCELVVVWVRG